MLINLCLHWIIKLISCTAQSLRGSCNLGMVPGGPGMDRGNSCDMPGEILKCSGAWFSVVKMMLHHSEDEDVSH